MANRLHAVWKLPYTLLAFAALVVAVFGASSWLSHASRGRQEEKLQVKNQTGAIEVVGAKVLDGSLHLSVRNSSGKNITWYKLLLGDMGLEAEFTYASRPVLAPGEVHTEVFPANPGLAKSGISVLSVLFEDGTGEGDQQFIGQIKERRHGEKMQLVRVLALLEQISNSPEGQRVSALDTLGAKINDLPEGQEDNLPEHVRLGLRSGKSQALGIIKGLQDGRPVLEGVAGSKALAGLKKRYQEIISRL